LERIAAMLEMRGKFSDADVAGVDQVWPDNSQRRKFSQLS
jgi:hypothetical protein